VPGSWPHRVDHPRHALAVSVGASGSYPAPSPISLRIWVHPLVSFVPLQSPPCPHLPVSVSGCEHLPWGCGPSSRRPPSQACDEDPTSSPSVRGVLHALDDLCPTRLCRFVSPCCRVQGSTLQGLFLLAQPYELVARRCPLVGWPASPVAGCPSTPAPRAPSSGLCSMREVRRRRFGFTLDVARSPRGLVLLQVFPLTTVDAAFTAPSAHRL